MKAIEVTIQNLIGSGMDPKTENNPYLGFLYTSFQERATKVRPATQALSHTRPARAASTLACIAARQACMHGERAAGITCSCITRALGAAG